MAGQIEPLPTQDFITALVIIVVLVVIIISIFGVKWWLNRKHKRT